MGWLQSQDALGREVGPQMLYASGFQSSPGLECHRSSVLFRSSCPSQQLWLHRCPGNRHQALPCRSHLQLWPEVLMWRSSLGRCTKAKMLHDVCGNLGNPALLPPCWVPEQHMVCPALPWSLPQLGIVNLAHSAMLVWLSCSVPGCHRQALWKSSQTSVCSQLLAIPPRDCSAFLK